MTSILKADTIQDTDGNNIINESGNTITIGASGDTTNIVGTLQNNGAAVGGDNTPMFLVSGGSGNQTISHASGTTITYNQEIIDTDNAFASNVFTVPSGEAGKYFFSASCQIEDTQADVQRFVLEIQKNDSSWRQLAFRFTSNQDLMQVSHTVTAIDDASVGDAYKAKVYVETADSGSVIIENSSTSYSNNWFQGFKLL
tara:strand:+ start:1141 stop:1737 length:597 start_codon:yes stop_codon:yes gene_type:complete